MILLKSIEFVAVDKMDNSMSIDCGGRQWRCRPGMIYDRNYPRAKRNPRDVFEIALLRRPAIETYE